MRRGERESGEEEEQDEEKRMGGDWSGIEKKNLSLQM